ncbi:MAG: hypothetical protein QXR60_02450 [Candidatus Nanoarchaeia archaeon]
MPIEVEVKPYECCGGFFVTARLDGVVKGLYMAHLESENMLDCYITSLQPSSGIPRVLISKATEEIGKMARRVGRKLIHRVILINERSQTVLPHIYEEFGYKNNGMDGFHLIMTKEYFP